MKRVQRITIPLFLVSFLLLCAIPTSALAADATSVLVNGVTLTSAAPYWANGSGSASATKPASGGYIHFDAAENTLTLHNADVGAGSTPPGSSTLLSGIYVNGDIQVVLSGSSTISFACGPYTAVYGLDLRGEATISGDGSLNIQLSNVNANSTCRAVYSVLDLTVLSGTLSLYAASTITAYGLSSGMDILFAGGSAQIETDASQSEAFSTHTASIRITGGDISAVSKSSGAYASVLYSSSVYLQGGTGSFTAVGGDISCGLGFRSGELMYTGGLFYFSGSKTAIVYDKDVPDYNFSAPTGTVFVSYNTDGSNLMPWTSDEDGLLISLFTVEYSDFLFVRFGILPAPQTGDAQMPLLWAGIALLGLLAAAAAYVPLKRRAHTK